MTSSFIKIVCISDTHTCHRQLKVPDGDILIHAGDFTLFGKKEHFLDFNDWLGTLPHQHKLVVYGNHEKGAVQQDHSLAGAITNASLLVNESTVVEGLKIYGTQFEWPLSPMSLVNPYASMPTNIDILISHGPVKNYADGKCGCLMLFHAVQKAQPRMVVCGHIHDAHGIQTGSKKDGLQDTTFINCAQCRNGYSLGWDPIVFHLPRRKEA